MIAPANAVVGDVVLTRHYAYQDEIKAVIVEINDNRVACIARLRKDDTVRQERIWTALWFSIREFEVNNEQALLKRVLHELERLDGYVDGVAVNAQLLVDVRARVKP